jgi:hypothetical protein
VLPTREVGSPPLPVWIASILQLFVKSFATGSPFREERNRETLAAAFIHLEHKKVVRSEDRAVLILRDLSVRLGVPALTEH